MTQEMPREIWAYTLNGYKIWDTKVKQTGAGYHHDDKVQVLVEALEFYAGQADPIGFRARHILTEWNKHDDMASL